MIPILIVPPLMFTILLMLPFLEGWITGDKREHHLLQRPRNAPTRTALMVALMTFYGFSWSAGGNDIIAITFDLSINQITYFMRVAVFLGPVIAFILTKRWCISLQRKDEEALLHGYETGIIMRSPEGGYSERHLPISEARAFTMTARQRDPSLAEIQSESNGADSNGLEPKRNPLAPHPGRLRTTMYADNIQKPTAEELEAARPPRRPRARAPGADGGCLRRRPPVRRSPPR